jgi:hypothetical protein
MHSDDATALCTPDLLSEIPPSLHAALPFLQNPAQTCITMPVVAVAVYDMQPA